MTNNQTWHLKFLLCCCFIIIQTVKTDFTNSCTNEQIGYSYLRKYGYITKEVSSRGRIGKIYVVWILLTHSNFNINQIDAIKFHSSQF